MMVSMNPPINEKKGYSSNKRDDDKYLSVSETVSETVFHLSVINDKYSTNHHKIFVNI